MHNTRNSHWSIEPHSIFLNESKTGDPWNGFADLPLTTTSSANGDEEAVQIKAEVFLFDSKDCSSSVRIAYLELGDKEDRSIQESHWIPVSETLFLPFTVPEKNSSVPVSLAVEYPYRSSSFVVCYRVGGRLQEK